MNLSPYIDLRFSQKLASENSERTFFIPASTFSLPISHFLQATVLDVEKKTMKFQDGEEIQFDKVLLATGGK